MVPCNRSKWRGKISACLCLLKSTNSDGIFGMCMSYQGPDYQTGPLLVDQLASSGKIKARIFAFYLATNTEAQSFVQIGEYSTQYMRDRSSLIWMGIPSGYFWSVQITGFRVGSVTSSIFSVIQPVAFSFGSTQAIFDTATSLVYMPDCRNSYV